MRGRAADCTFHVRRAGYHQKCWESVYIEIDSIDNPESKWLERGHPLTAFNPSKLYPIWKRCGYPGDNVPHDLAKLLQKPPSIRPSNSVTARLPDTGSRRSASHLDCEALDLLQQKLQLAVPDFQSSSRSMQSSRKVYNSSAYSLQETATRLNGDILSKLRRGQKASLTSFDLFAEKLAESGRLRRHYTQNIDCRQARLPSLSKKTIWLHGRADTMVCHITPTHTLLVNPQSFKRWQ